MKEPFATLIKFTVLLALALLSGQWTFPVPGTALSVSFQSLFLLLPAFFLRGYLAIIIVAIYLLAGGLGLPVFANGSFGWITLFGPHRGFFAGFAIAVLFATSYNANERSSPLGILSIWLIGQLIVLVLGYFYLFLISKNLSVLADSWKFLPGLAIKTLIGWNIVAVGRTRGL